MNAIVTGSTGFLGRRLCATLVEAGWGVLGVARHETPVPGVRSLVGDLGDAGTVAAMWAAGPADALFHLAWETTPGAYLQSPANLAHLRAAVGVLEGAALHVPWVLQAGTCLEYAWPTAPVDEDAPVAATDLYTACKLAQREVGARLCEARGAEHLWARVFYPVGPGSHPGRLVPRLQANLAAGQPFALSADGALVRDFIHVDDVARALLACATTRATGVVNVGSGTGTALRDLVLRLAEAAGAAHLVRFGAEPDRAEPPVRVARTERLRATGWRPRPDAFSG